MKPERVIRIGAISASVFANEVARDGQKVIVRNVRLQRRYKDADGEWKSNASFTLSEMPGALAVLRLAFEHVAAVEAHAT